ncbi:MAG: DUF4339 domain-containing protein [Oligoflexia bacterium]|nr:DUF4339 domain-containing protein [Oligoflexia bacterium]
MNDSEKIWFLHDGKDRVGPISTEEVTERLAGSADQYHVWKRGMIEWTPAKDIGELWAIAKEESEPAIRLEPVGPSSPTDIPIKDAEPKSGLFADEAVHVKKSSGALKRALVALLFAVIASGAGYALWPNINRWLTRLPEISDASDEQKNLLQAAASSGASDPASAPVEMILTASSSAAQSPVFYVAANLPDGAELTLELQPDPTMISGPAPGNLRTSVTLQHRLGHTDPIKANDGGLLPRGEYQVSVLDPDHHTRVSRRLFLGNADGGKTDGGPAFKQELEKYQANVIAQARSELFDLKNAATQLAAIVNGDANLDKAVKKARTAQAREKVKAAWAAQRAQLESDTQKSLQANIRFFVQTRNAALAVHDAIQDQSAGKVLTIPVDQLRTDLAAKLDAAEKRLQAASGYFVPEK